MNVKALNTGLKIKGPHPALGAALLFVFKHDLHYFTSTLSRAARARLRSIKHKKALLYSHLITTFLPLMM